MRDAVRVLPMIRVLPVLLGLACSLELRAQGVDYLREVEPILHASCDGGFCHLSDRTFGVSVATHAELLSSVGDQYGGPVVVPFDAEASPLWDKISRDTPRHGQRMPFGLPPLPADQIRTIARWIDEGALLAPRREILRGDITRDERLGITDAIAILGFLFLGDAPPHCDPVADSNGNGRVDITDAILLLEFLFLGGVAPQPLSEAELAECDGPNRPPVVDPIGTILGREGLALGFVVAARDPDRDRLRFTADTVPAEMTIDATSGRVSWTPPIGSAGDHRIRIRVADEGIPSLSTFATGLVRVLQGNEAPVITPPGTIYGREGVPLQFVWTARDSDPLEWTALELPEGAALDPSSGRLEWTPQIGDAGEHRVRVRVTDRGEPPRSAIGETSIVVVPADSPENQAPTIVSRAIYRSYPGLPIEFAVEARDPDGDGLSLFAARLPAGASLDPITGVFRWTPGDSQLGPFHVSVTARDDGVPPLSTERVLVFRIQPPDPCTPLDCDPALGCSEDVLPLDESCCGAPSDVRVAEPFAECPDGRVLHVGRNRRGFGRLQNCDLLRVEPFGQGGHTVRLNVEARCVNHEEAVSVRLRLETAGYLLFDEESARVPQLRADGFAQRIGFFLAVDRQVPIVEIEGAEALLTCVLTDADGVRLERRLRLVLTRAGLDELPEPDVADVPSGEAGCVGCHRPLGIDGERHGIEDAHPGHPLSCVDCHGGDASASTRAESHVAPLPGEPAVLRGLTSDQLDRVSPGYLQFVNPGDLRVARRGCGADNPANPGTGCHQSLVDSSRKSVMSTYAGHYTLPRYLAGAQDRLARFAAVDIVDPTFDARSAPEGAVQSFVALREPAPFEPRGTMTSLIDTYIPKSCPTCHLNDFGPDNSAGNYRSSGCTACHMVYDDDGLSRSLDPMVSKDFPSHPKKHELTTALPTEQCAHCHFQGGRIGLSFRGIREGGFSPEKTPPDAVPLDRVLHAHDRGYYFTDEDATNDIDETPPDAHHRAGMVCADCHVGGDVHGDGNLYSSERYQVGVRCEDCHGTVRAEIAEGPSDGRFKNAKGAPFTRVRRSPDNRILLRLAMSEREIEIPQVHRILESGVNQAMNEAMGVNANGFSHADSMECYTCHTSWRPTCFGCHVTVDDRSSGPNRTTGEESIGAVSVTRDDYSLDFFALGVNHRGRITPLCSSMSVFATSIDSNGVTRFEDQVRTSGDGRRGFGWNPFHHHTVSRVPQNCDRCHPVAGETNAATLRETYGFGTGRHLVTDGDGVTHDVSAFLDEAGALISDFPHPNTGPVPEALRTRALGILVVPHPRN